MSETPAPEHALNRSLRSVHRGVLGILAASAAVIWSVGEPVARAGTDPVSRRLAWCAAALAVGAILARRRQPGRVADPRTYVRLSVVSLLCAAAVGLVGVALAWVGGPRGTALVYVLAGAVFALRPPRPLVVEAPGASS